MGTLGTHQLRRGASTVIILVSVWAVSSALPSTAAGSPVWSLVDARIAPMAVLAAIASDRPDAAVGPRRSEHHGAVPAVISIEAGTRSALIHLVRAASLPGALAGMSRLASDLVRRGPPRSFAD